MRIRIDDFPHGDLTLFRSQPRQYWHDHFMRLVEPFEHLGVEYLLGVSAGLCTDEDFKLLSGLRSMRLAYHGYDHGWARYQHQWARITETWPHGGEFALMGHAAVIEQMALAMQRTPSSLVTQRIYIAPFNVVNQATLDALAMLHFTEVMGGKETVDFGMDRLNYHGMRLDLCTPPEYGYAVDVVRHLPEDDRTITLHWIYEQADAVVHWWEIARRVAERR